MTPSSTDGFYDSSTLLTFSQTPQAGWTLTGWQHDLSGTQNPITLTANDEMYVTAEYNTVSAPISVSSLSPASAVAGGAGFTLTINGAGFTANSVVFLNNTFYDITGNVIRTVAPVANGINDLSHVAFLMMDSFFFESCR